MINKNNCCSKLNKKQKQQKNISRKYLQEKNLKIINIYSKAYENELFLNLYNE